MSLSFMQMCLCGLRLMVLVIVYRFNSPYERKRTISDLFDFYDEIQQQIALQIEKHIFFCFRIFIESFPFL